MVGASALMGAQQAKAQRKAQEAQNQAAAAQTMWSPWTGMGAGQASYAPTQSSLQGALSGGLQGGLSAAMLNSSMGGGEAAAQPNMMDEQVASGQAYGPAKPENFQYQKTKKFGSPWG